MDCMKTTLIEDSSRAAKHALGEIITEYAMRVHKRARQQASTSAETPPRGSCRERAGRGWPGRPLRWSARVPRIDANITAEVDDQRESPVESQVPAGKLIAPPMFRANGLSDDSAGLPWDHSAARDFEVPETLN